MAKTTDNIGLQDSTTKLPMVDLEAAMSCVIQIREKALETAAMPAVAKALGYASATSTPFYRRIRSARLFNLLSQMSSLTQEAINYIKPHAEGMRDEVLRRAILGVPAYTDLVTTYSGKKLNVELVKNSIAKDFSLSDTCAMICAKAFEASLRFAGMLSADETVSVRDVAVNGGIKESVPETPKNDAYNGDTAPQARPTKTELPADVQEHTIFLDKAKLRRCTVRVPLDVTRGEYERICRWLEFTILIDQEQQAAT